MLTYFNYSYNCTNTYIKWLIYLIINCGNQNLMASFLKEINYKTLILIN